MTEDLSTPISRLAAVLNEARIAPSVHTVMVGDDDLAAVLTYVKNLREAGDRLGKWLSASPQDTASNAQLKEDLANWFAVEAAVPR